jgi:type II secretory pathway pseudopilin PulG
MTRANLRRGRRARGVAMLEVLVGLSILAVAGVALLVLLAQTMDAVDRRYRHDAATRAASARLDEIALWNRAQLDARIGATPHGAWTLRVMALTRTLYHVELADPTTGVGLLKTSLYRPDAIDETSR